VDRNTETVILRVLLFLNKQTNKHFKQTNKHFKQVNKQVNKNNFTVSPREFRNIGTFYLKSFYPQTHIYTTVHTVKVITVHFHSVDYLQSTPSFE